MKFIYVVTGNEKNIYIEQTWVSIWSLKYYNPDAKAVIVTDESTIKHIQSNPELIKLCTDIVSVHIDDEISEMEKSRWLKTKLRELIKGDFVYLDSDTIVTGDIRELNEVANDVNFVLDTHVSFRENFHHKRVIRLVRKIYGSDVSHELDYYNGGFFIAKDTDMSHRFFKEWHENWKISMKKGLSLDQMALLMTCMNNPNIVKPLPGIYNCQLTYSVAYLHDAKIVHFQRLKKRIGEPISEFYKNDIYKKIKQQGYIGDDDKERILHCKSNLSVTATPINKQEYKILNSYPVAALKKLYSWLGLLK